MNNHIAEMVDNAFEIDREIKDLQEKLKDLKESIRLHASAKGLDKVEGNLAVATVSPDTRTEIDVCGLMKLAKKLGLEKVLPTLLKAKVEETRKALGEINLASVSTTASVPFAKVRLDLKKG